MTRTVSMSQDIEISVDWKKLAKDLKEKFGIDIPEDDIDAFCCENEMAYLSVQYGEQCIEEIHTNDLTFDEEIIAS